MTHPSFEILNEYAKTDQPQSIKEHLNDCERCSTIMEGLRIALTESEKRKISSDQLFNESSEISRVKVDQEIAQRKSNKRFRWSLLHSVAASISLILIFTFYFYSTRFVADDFVAFQMTNNLPSPNVERNATSENQWALFVKNYGNKDYEKALAVTNDFDDLGQNNSLEFFTGLCYMLTEPAQYEKASEVLLSISNSNSRYNEQARWYLALVYYQQGKLDSCREVLLRINEIDDHFRSSAALEFLNNLE